MSRTRAIKPSFFDNERLGELAPLARLLFIGLWCEADRAGRLEDRPKRLRKTLLGYDNVTDDDVDDMLAELQKADFIQRYQVDSNYYIAVINFIKHQNPHPKEKPSVIPTPPERQIISAAQGNDEVVPLHGKDVPLHGKYMARQEQEMPLSIPSVIYSFCTPPTPPTSDDEELTKAGRAKKEPRSSQKDEFNTFWAACPKKVGKGAAEAAWRKLKPDATLTATILAAVERSKQSRQWLRDGGQYIPNPATWLNQRRWEDEPDTKARASPAPAPQAPGHAGQSTAMYDTDSILMARIDKYAAEHPDEDEEE